MDNIPDDNTLKGIVVNLRLYAAQILLGWVLKVVPKDHPEGEAIVAGLARLHAGYLIAIAEVDALKRRRT